MTNSATSLATKHDIFNCDAASLPGGGGDAHPHEVL
jgi:hypothetical protein